MKGTPWFRLPATQTTISKKALVIGAGLAGSCSARALAERGWKITVLEQGCDSASGASGNRAALLRPHATRDASTAQQFLADAYTTGLELFTKLLHEKKLTQGQAFFKQTGALQLSNNTQGYRESKHLQIVSRESASQLCGIDLPVGGLYFPTAGSVDIAGACKALLDHPGITLQCEFTAQQFLRENDNWQVSNSTTIFSAPTLVLANGATLGNFDFTGELTITATRGQTTLVTPGSQVSPDIPVCGKHYLIPQHHPDSSVPCWHIGASFDRTSDQAIVTPADDDANLDGINELLGNGPLGPRLTPLSKQQIIDNWAAVRATTPDRLPIVGSLPDSDFYRTRYADLHHGKIASSYPNAEYLPGLYVNGGYGSRGLCVGALCSELLATQITGETSEAKITTNRTKRDLYLKLLHPARFHIRRLKKSRS